MILTKVLPGVLKELSKHVPTILFQTVEWGELASEIPRLSRRLLQREGYEELYQANQHLLAPYGISVTDSPVSVSHFENDREAGIKLLTLYFVQLYSPHGIFLDLRSQNFTLNDGNLIWHPTTFWTKFEEKFQRGLLKVYEGFYLENDELYYDGLKAIGLIKDHFSGDDRKELGELFRKHFGSALDEDMVFTLEHFQQSIVKMSEFMLRKKVHISKDFLYLGIYLVTLYAGLEQTRKALPVKQIYLDVRGRFNSGEIR